MSTAEILSLVSLISYILAGVCLVLTAFFWFFFKIPAVIGDLSGRTARKSIEKMRQSNERSGNKAYRASVTNVARGKVTDAIQNSANMKKTNTPAEKETVESDIRPETGLLAENKAETVYSDETAALDTEEVTGMLVDKEATEVLDAEVPAVKRTSGKALTMIEEVMLVHTDEVIV